ncbi:MAG: hypothetical protein EOO04_08050 [Chitinophagaceae bacterium]|nr:MAG: hypothetical protein EOO04_08050 [Chitinophagaceae bacterium]
MKFLYTSFLLLIFSAACSSDEADPALTEPIVAAYDTVEIEYQKLGELAAELVSNVAVDPRVPVLSINEALENEPVVSIDFAKPVTTRKDINNFVKHQQKIDASLQQLFNRLAGDPRWQNAPLISEFKQRYQLRLDSIQIAIGKFNAIVTKSPYDISIAEQVTISNADSASLN